MRKLATLRKVVSVEPIPNADAIEAVTVDGWTCVSMKGNFKVGDVGLYFEVDSFLPMSNPAFDFLEKNAITYNGIRGARLKTIRLRGQLSQGLLLPLHLFPEIESYVGKMIGINGSTIIDWLCEECDFTEGLRIVKWEKPDNGDGCWSFPPWIKKTDQDRVQNIPRLFTQHLGESFEESYKMNGQSCSMYFLAPGNKWIPKQVEALRDPESDPETPLIMIDNPRVLTGHFGVCSRNFDVEEAEGNPFWTLAKKIHAKTKLEDIATRTGGRSFAVQGEMVGPGIQGNTDKLSEIKFLVYSVFYIDAFEYLPPKARRKFCKDNGFDHVAVADEDVVITDNFIDMNDLIAYADGPGVNLGTKREGFVYKSNVSEFSFKVISNKFLLSEKD